MNDSFLKFKDKIIDRYFETAEEIVEENENGVEIVKEESRLEMEPQFKIEHEIRIVLEPTKIAAQTEIQGNLTLQGDLNVCGKIIGDIMAEGNILIDGGEVVGNIQGKSISIINSRIQGNITSESSIEVHKNSEVVGHIRGKNVTLESCCKGNVHANEVLHLMTGSSVKGDIHTMRLKIDEGGFVDGQIKMKTMK